MKNKFILFSLTSFLLISACNSSPNINPELNSEISALSTTRTWTELSQMPTPRYNMQANLVDNKIYVSGGLNNDIGILATFEVFDTNTKQWSQLPALPSPRYIHSSVEVNKKLYLIGGYAFAEDTKNILKASTKHGALNIVDSYDTKTGKWESLKSMPTERFMPGAAVHNGKIYVAGGAQKGVILNTLEVYDPSNNSWQKLADLPTPRVWGKLLKHGKYLYLVGGSAGNNSYLGSVDRYDPATDTWATDSLPAMNIPRWGFGATIDQNGIYIAGGSNENGFTASVEYFNFKSNTWNTLPEINPARGGVDIITTTKGLYLFGMDPWATNNTLFLAK